MEKLRLGLAIAILLLVGAATLVFSLELPHPGLPLLVHRQIMMAMLGGGLLLSAFLPALRLPAMAAGVLGKSTLAAVLFATQAPWVQVLLEGGLGLLLVLAGAVFLHDAWQESRWNRGLPLRQG